MPSSWLALHVAVRAVICIFSMVPSVLIIICLTLPAWDFLPPTWITATYSRQLKLFREMLHCFENTTKRDVCNTWMMFEGTNAHFYTRRKPSYLTNVFYIYSWAIDPILRWVTNQCLGLTSETRIAFDLASDAILRRSTRYFSTIKYRSRIQSGRSFPSRFQRTIYVFFSFAD